MNNVIDLDMRLKRRNFIALLDSALIIAEAITQDLKEIDACLEKQFPQALAA